MKDGNSETPGQTLKRVFAILFLILVNNIMIMNERIKAEISQMPDEIEDEDILYMIKEDIAHYTKEKDIVDDLDPEQLKGLDEAIHEAENNTGTVSWEDFKMEMNEWKKR